ncbi:MAG: tetratricopeptide repeat protein [Phycisphaerales bacterium]|nr:tetratricopeptide repeat protein [Phycisphaerales bacterium]
MQTTAPKARLSIACLLLGALLAAPLGCSSTQTRSGSKDGKSDPVAAYSARRQAEALEHIRKAEALEAAGKNDEAILEYRAALETKNDMFAAWNNLGHLLMKKENYADAVSAFQVASRLQPGDPRPEYNIGLAYQRVGWAQDSFLHFELALDRDPVYLPALRGAVRSAEMLGQADQQVLDFIRSAQLRETEEQWKTYFQRQRVRVESQLSLAHD